MLASSMLIAGCGGDMPAIPEEDAEVDDDAIEAVPAPSPEESLHQIVGGTETPITSAPFMVSVLPAAYQCGGTLIHARWVLTAAHCVDAMKPGQIKVRLGSVYSFRGGSTHIVQKRIIHPDYDADTTDSDIALLKIPESVYAASHTVPVATTTPSDGSTAQVFGYGTLSSNGNLAESLRAAQVNIVNFNKCNDNYGGVLTNQMLCAAAPGKDACQGDSGGPLMQQGKVVGIVSWASGCGSPKYPGVYTRVAKFKDWIKNTITNN